MRRKGELWKRNPDDPERYARATTAYEEGAKVLIDALAQMDPNKRGYEATRHWEMQNELASIYCDWGWMTWQAGGLSAAYDLYQQSVKTQTEALNFARTRKYIFQTADSLDDLAQAKGDLSYLLARNNQLEESQKWRVEAKQHLAEVMNDIVPASQHLGGDSMSSDLIADVRSESYWQCLGKAHLWLGIWGARDLELKLASEQIAPAVFEDFMKSETYFAAYSGATSAFLQRTESYIAHFLELRLLQPSAIQGYIQAFQTQYKVQLSGLSQLVDNVLGYYDW